MKKGPDLSASLEPVNDLEIAIQHPCEWCNKPLEWPVSWEGFAGSQIIRS
jgi:hypothetical protein